MSSFSKGFGGCLGILAAGFFILFLLGGGCLVLMGNCMSHLASDKTERARQETETSIAPVRPTPTEPETLQTIPYKIINRSAFSDDKQSYDVEVDLVEGRLPRREELAAISRKLYSREFENTFVCYYLPGMEVDAGAFATGHFTPDLEIAIYTLHIPARYKALVDGRPVTPGSEPEPETAHELRTWTTSDGKFTIEARFVRYGSSIVTLHKMNGKTIDVPIEKLSKEDQDYTMATQRAIGRKRRETE